MTAAQARLIVAELGVKTEVAKIVADAPEPSTSQLEALRSIFAAAALDATKAGTDEPAFALTDTAEAARSGRGPE